MKIDYAKNLKILKAKHSKEELAEMVRFRIDEYFYDDRFETESRIRAAIENPDTLIAAFRAGKMSEFRAVPVATIRRILREELEEALEDA